MRVLITDISSYKAIAFARSLTRRGIEVVSADSRSYTTGIRSRHSTRHYLYPSPVRTPDRFVERLVGIVRAERPEVLVPTNSLEVRLCLRERGSFGTSLSYLGNLASFEALDDKDKLRRLAAELGIRSPRHYSIDDQIDRFPLVFKPAEGSSSKGVRYLRGIRELDSIRRLAPTPGTYVLQEFIEGEGVGYSVLCREGAIVAGCGHRRLAELPISGGSSTVRESFSHPQFRPIAEALVANTRWSGLAMFEFKLAANGDLYLIEANPRVWGSINQAIQAGMDMPAMLVLGDYAPGAVEQRPCTTFLAPLHWLSLAQYALRKGDLHPMREFLSRRRDAVADVSIFDDPLGYLSMLLRIVGS